MVDARVDAELNFRHTTAERTSVREPTGEQFTHLTKTWEDFPVIFKFSAGPIFFFMSSSCPTPVVLCSLYVNLWNKFSQYELNFICM